MIDFDADVLERSRAVPVVVDFWAEWCGPCRVLGPILEQLAAEAAGRWELVKIDTEQQPDVAASYGISGIPAVKLFQDGGVVAEFVGALPAKEIRRWLDAHLPDPRTQGLDAIIAAWPSRGPAVAAELEAFVAEHPDLPAARLRLAQAIVAQDPDGARRLVHDAAAGADDAELAAAVTNLADLMECSGELPPRIAAHVAGARSSLAENDLAATLEHLVDWAMLDRKFGDELARRAAVALFYLLGDEHELTQEYRRRLAMAVNA